MTYVTSEDRRPKGGPLFEGKCLFGAFREPKQIVKPADKSLTFRALSKGIEGMAAEVERMLEEGDEE